VLEAEGIALAEANIKSIRARLVQNGSTTAANEIIHAEVDRIFANAVPATVSVEDCVSQLNGDARKWARGVLNEAKPLASLETFPDKIHHKKVFLMASGAAESSAYRNVQAAVPEQWTDVVAQNHPSSELVCIVAEECTSYAEYPEIVNLFSEIRGLPEDEFNALATICDPKVLREFYPERTENDCSPGRLLAGALVFEVIRRSGSQNYVYDGDIIGKGCQAALEALRDSTLATEMEQELIRRVSSEGLVSATTKLNEAKQRATVFVPKEFAGRDQFCEWIDESVTHFNRRLAKSQ
jgi:hypothetical protein